MSMKAALIISNSLMIATALFLFTEATGMRTFANSTYNSVAVLVAITASLTVWALLRGQKIAAMCSVFLIACSIGLMIQGQSLVPPPIP